MKIIIGKTAGFCFGVKKAVETALKYASKNTCTLGPIIHNKNIIDKLKTKGVEVIKNIEDANNRLIIIRAHGIQKENYFKLKTMGLDYIDCTCPFVKKIHTLVEKNFSEHKKIIIIGDENHPEVIGINSYADNQAFILKDLDEAKKFNNNKLDSYALVVQTTFSYDLFYKIIEIIKADNIKIYNTICNATNERQTEAENISRIVDKMIVLGDKSSSNSTKLFNICQKNCRDTFFIQDITELDLRKFDSSNKIGIMAGASTPPNIIEEAILFMKRNINSSGFNYDYKYDDQKSFEQMLNESFIDLHVGDTVSGEVVGINDNEVILNIGYKSDGIIKKESFSSSSEPLKNLVKIGDKINAIVLRIQDDEDIVMLSKKIFDLRRGYNKLKEALDKNLVLTGKVVNTGSSGVNVLVNEVKVFIPASRFADKHVGNLENYMGQDISFRVIEFNPETRRYIGSRKELLETDSKSQSEQEKNDKDFFDKIEVGDKFEGVINNIADFGVFVDLGGHNSLLHKSEMVLKSDTDFKKEFSVGQKINVFIKRIDKARDKIYVTMKLVNKNPWINISNRYPVNKIVIGRVIRIVDFGAFINLEPGIDGLLHKSRIYKKKRVQNVNDELKINQVLKFRVLNADEKNKSIKLSLIGVVQD